MKLVGLTGGIGSGKSTVAKYFNTLGIPVYHSDDRAKAIMEEQVSIKAALIQLFGSKAYVEDRLNRAYIAELAFSNPELLKKLNALVHPAVRADFLAWSKQQEAPYVIQEAAVLFENGGYKNLDYNILVKAPQEAREQRVMGRDAITRAQVQARMQNQWSDERKEPLADFVIENLDLESTQHNVLKIHELLLQAPENRMPPHC